MLRLSMLLPWLSFLPAFLWKLLQQLLQAPVLLLWLFFMCWSTCCNCCCHIPNGTGAAPSAVALSVITAPAPLEFLCHTAVQLLLLPHTAGAAVVAADPHHWCRGCCCPTPLVQMLLPHQLLPFLPQMLFQSQAGCSLSCSSEYANVCFPPV